MAGVQVRTGGGAAFTKVIHILTGRPDPPLTPLLTTTALEEQYSDLDLPIGVKPKVPVASQFCRAAGQEV